MAPDWDDALRAWNDDRLSATILSSQFKDFAERLNNASALIQKVMAPGGELARSLQTASRFGEQFSRVMRSFDVEKLTKLSSAYSEHMQVWLKHLEAELERAEPEALRLAKRGWVGLGHHTTPSGLISLGQRLNKRDYRRFDVEIVKTFHANRHRKINAMVRGWWSLPVLKRRKSQVLAAIRAHKRGEYLLSVPVLFALVDAVCAEYVKNPRPRGTNHIKDVAKSESAKRDKSLEWAIAKLFYSSHTKPRTFSTLNRHEVLHGRTWNYGTDATSLKVILLLDTLVRATRRRAVLGKVRP